ncbi:DUF2812 domain-containing protein [Fredinandcohnia humi]
MIKRTRLFWSYDVLKTEEWLTEMAAKGYELVGLNRWTRIFTFREAAPKQVIYRITRNNATLPKTLQKEGWINVTQSGSWSIMSNESLLTQIKTSPVRNDIIKHNRLIRTVYGFVTAFLIGIVLNPIIFFLSSSGESTFVKSPLWGLTFLFFGTLIAIVVIGIYSFVKIPASNRRLMSENQGTVKTNDGLSREQEKELKRTEQIIIKRKLGWIYAPDKMEKWLENMEAQGYHLYRVNRFGVTFYFTVGEPRQVSYALDYQNLSDESYFAIHKEAGWNMVYASPSTFQKWTIWNKVYPEVDEKPRFYSDKSHKLKHAKRVAVTYSILFAPMILIYSFLLVVFIIDFTRNQTLPLMYLNFVTFLFVILSFGTYTVRTWLYYRRLKRQEA